MMKRGLSLVGISLSNGAAISKETPASGGGSIFAAGTGVTPDR